MTSNTNNKSVQSEILENQLYEVLLYKKMEVLAIQERLAERNLGMVPLGLINDNANQTALNQSKKAKTLYDSYGLLFDLVEETIPILRLVAAPSLKTSLHLLIRRMEK